MMNENLSTMETSRTELQAIDLVNLDEKKLLLLFHQQNWKRMNKNERLRALQEVENRRAKADGRPPVKISTRPMKPNTYGGHLALPDGSEAIYINPRFLENSKLFGNTGSSIFNAANALNTVLHEGRHAFQFNAIKNNFDNVPELQKLEWAAVMGAFGGLYTSSDPIFYYLQSIEMDARRFARRKIAQVNSYFNSLGMGDRNFANQTSQDLQRETLLICRVRLYLDHDKINQYEKRVLAYFKRNHPQLDLKNLRLFDHARFILDHPHINNPLKMLDELDKLADAKLGFKDGQKLNLIKDTNLSGFGSPKG